MASFADYKKVRRRGSGCAVCGEPVEGRVVVTLQARERAPGKTTKDTNAMRFPGIDSTSASYCEIHAVETYENARKALPPPNIGNRGRPTGEDRP